MATVTIGVANTREDLARLRAAAHGTPQGSHISFASFDLLWKVLTPKRMQIVDVLSGAGTLSIREVARRVGRDVRAVHADVVTLIKSGVIRRVEGGVAFPYSAIHVNFTLKAA
ncbi:MAG TPA: transcriptional regulator [Rhodanobacteraceae bacterium]